MSAEQALRAMLPRLDAALERELLRLRGRYQLSLDELRGLYVSDARVDALLLDNAFDPRRDEPLPAVPPAPLWQAMAARLGLDTLDQDMLLAVLAPTLDPRYSPIYAYLNDEAGRRLATSDLLMRLFGAGWDGREAVRRRLAPDAPLLRARLVSLDSAAGLAGMLDALAPSPLLPPHLLGGDVLVAAGLSRVRDDDDDAFMADEGQDALAALLADAPARPILILAGREGTGRRAAARQLAVRTGRVLAELPLGADSSGEAVRGALLACRLTGTALVLVAAGPPPEGIADLLAGAPVPVMLAVDRADNWERALRAVPSLTVPFAVAPFDQRRRQWRDALRAEGVSSSPAAIDAAAGRFRLPGGAILRAARDVRLVGLAPPGAKLRVPAAALIAAGRRQCAIDLGPLATRVDARPGWEDLVLPAATRQQLRDLAGAASERDRVYQQWGMGGVGRGAGNGIAALFAGASGTGKTMAAAVIARGIGLDLWRIDLSSVVSKYIGETEKNLERIFTAARDGDAILFFDEADALFGKRSEVRDAHDRYANVEVAYLLQRLEEHDGIAILASNFSRNIDQAFVRRLHYIVEFPLPDERLREQLWRKAFARATPVEGNVDHAFLARGFALAGGDIRAAALDAAFLAASDGGMVTMPHILRAVSRQMLKQGKLPSARDFGQWQDKVAAAPNGIAA